MRTLRGVGGRGGGGGGPLNTYNKGSTVPYPSPPKSPYEYTYCKGIGFMVEDLGSGFGV